MFGMLILGLGERLEIEKSGDRCGICNWYLFWFKFLFLRGLRDRVLLTETLPENELTDAIELDLPLPLAANLILLKL